MEILISEYVLMSLLICFSGDTTLNGNEGRGAGNPETSSRSSREDLSASEKSSKKEKKSKGFRTPSFLKKKKHKKEKEGGH